MGSGWIGSGQDPAIIDPAASTGQVTLSALLKGLLTQMQGGGPAGKAQPAVLYGPGGQPLPTDATTGALNAVLTGSYATTGQSMPATLVPVAGSGPNNTAQPFNVNTIETGVPYGALVQFVGAALSVWDDAAAGTILLHALPNTSLIPTAYSGTTPVYITTATTTSVKSSAGVVGTLSNASGAVTGTITVYDSTTGSGNVVWTGTLAAGQILPIGMPCATGITIVTAAADAIAVSYA